MQQIVISYFVIIIIYYETLLGNSAVEFFNEIFCIQISRRKDIFFLLCTLVEYAAFLA